MANLDCPRYEIKQAVPLGTIEEIAPESDGVKYLINGSWYGEAEVSKSITEDYYRRNAWARPGAKYAGRSFVTGHYRS